MRLTVHAFVTLDGVMQGPGGPEEDTSGGFDAGGWLVPLADEDMGRIVDSWFAQAEAFLLGRTTYDMMRDYWSQVTDPDDPVAARLNGLPKHLVTSRPEGAGWQSTTVLEGHPVPAVIALKERPGGELQVHGSWRLAQTLHNAGLVDEYRLLVFPVVLGSGKRLFGEGVAPSGFDVVGSEVTSGGLVHLLLRPRPLGGGGEFYVEDGREATR